MPCQVNNVVATKKGSALALSFLYMASARQLGVPLRALNCTARMKVPVDFIVRHDPADGEGADSMAIFVDLAQQGKVVGVEAVPQDTHFEGTQGAVPHVQLYSRVMHKLADVYARVGQVGLRMPTLLARLDGYLPRHRPASDASVACWKQEEQVLVWLQQIRILQVIGRGGTPQTCRMVAR